MSNKFLSFFFIAVVLCFLCLALMPASVTAQGFDDIVQDVEDVTGEGITHIVRISAFIIIILGLVGWAYTARQKGTDLAIFGCIGVIIVGIVVLIAPRIAISLVDTLLPQSTQIFRG